MTVEEKLEALEALVRKIAPYADHSQGCAVRRHLNARCNCKFAGLWEEIEALLLERPQG